jgi:catechol 2,3-dioxygenase-like lactoylglutathione lyase family enzyme
MSTETQTTAAAAQPGPSEPPASVGKLLYSGVRTPDPEAMVAYYVDVLGFALVSGGGADEVAYLTPGPDHHAVAVERGAADGRSRLGLQLHGGLDMAAQRLADAGIPATRRTDPEPGVNEDLVVEEPGAGAPIHLVETFGTSDVATSLGTTPTKLGHVAAYVPDVAVIQAFYERVLGFRWADTIGDFFVFLRCNAEHHAVNFMQSSDRSGLHHVAYEMRDVVHLTTMLDHLAKHDRRLEWGPGRHGPGHNIFTYHRDPDGNVVELFCQLDVVHDEKTGAFEPRPWHDTFPQVPRVWDVDVVAANSWGPINPVFLEH